MPGLGEWVGGCYNRWSHYMDLFSRSVGVSPGAGLWCKGPCPQRSVVHSIYCCNIYIIYIYIYMQNNNASPEGPMSRVK